MAETAMADGSGGTTITREWAVQGDANGHTRQFTPWTADRNEAAARLAQYRSTAQSVTYRLAVRTTTVTTSIEENA